VNRTLTELGLFSGFFLLASGLYLWLGPANASAQLLQLLHVGVGLLLLVPMVVAVISHIQLRLRARPESMDAMAWLCGALLLIVGLSGLAVFAGGLRWYGASNQVALVHLVAGLALAPVIGLHILLALRKQTGGTRKAEYQGRRYLPVLAGTVALVGLALAGGAWLEGRPGVTSVPGENSETASRTNTATPTTLASGPEAGALVEPAPVRVKGEQLLHRSVLSGSADCQSCHPAIYEQWSESMHRHAANDEHVVTGIQWFRRDNGVEAARFCVACHDPISLLAGDFDPEHLGSNEALAPSDEGISCRVCHSIDSVQEPLGSGSFRIDPPAQAVFGDGRLADAMVRMDGRGHAASMLRPGVHETARFCGACHQQVLPGASKPPKPSDLDHQYPEWLASHYSDPDSEQFATCQDCHMPLVDAADPAAKNGKVRSHRFPGANHAHAVKMGYQEQAEATLALLRDGVAMTILVPEQQDKAGHIVINVRVENRKVGHNFPSGTTDISEAWIEFTAGPPEAPRLQSGMLDEDHYLDPAAHSWRKVLVDRRNLPVDLHNLAAVEGKLFDKHIKAGESDTARYEVPLGYRTTGTLELRARLRLRKANQRWNDWLFNFDGRTVPITDVHEQSLSIDLSNLALTPAPIEPKQNEDSARLQSDHAALAEGADQATMVRIPGGTARIGSEDGEPDERPARTIEVATFLMDRYPVTNAEYREYLVAMSQTGPVLKLPWADKYNWTGMNYPEGTGEQPAILMTQDEAAGYCAWRGSMRLPTEAEWEKAARGPGGWRYPWGENWKDGDCLAVSGMDVPDRVGMCSNRRSIYGIGDLVGGVFEWTSDPYYAYDRTFLHSNANEWLVTFDPLMFTVRGVPPNQEGPATTASTRSGQNGYQRGRVGFRCVQPEAS